jgi:hypothetical protein
MKFNILVAMVPSEEEAVAIETAKKAGAGSVTILNGKTIGLKEKKVFFGLTLEENVSLLLFILPQRLTMLVFKALRKKFHLSNHAEAKGLLFTIPLTHLSGMEAEEVELFEKELLDVL